MENERVATPRRLFSLDVLRGLAILLVLINHMPSRPSAAPSPIEAVAARLQEVGWVGVDLFFVLSGFLISGLLFQEIDGTGGIDIGRFWLRRGLKIWPSYFAAYGGMIVVTLVVESLFTRPVPQGHSLVANILPNALFVQNYARTAVPWPHSWSLAIEEHFYLVLPGALALSGRARRDEPSAGRFRRLPVVVLFVILGILVARVVTVVAHPNVDPTLRYGLTYYPTHLRSDGLAFGVLLGYFAHTRSKWLGRCGRHPWAITLFTVAAVMFVAAFPREQYAVTYTAGFSLLAICFGGLVLLAAAHPNAGLSDGRWSRPVPRLMAGMGVYSYTIYLGHSVVASLPGFDLLRRHLDRALWDSVWLDRLLFFGVSLGAGILLSHLVERPMLRFRSRVLPSRSRRGGGHATSARRLGVEATDPPSPATASDGASS